MDSRERKTWDDLRCPLRRGWAGTLALTAALSAAVAGPAFAGPQLGDVTEAPSRAAPLPAAAAAPTFSFEGLEETMASTDAAIVPASTFTASSDEQPPMIPLPPVVWMGLAGVAGIAVRAVRPKGRR